MKAVMSEVMVVCTCSENKPVTLVEDNLGIFLSAEEKVIKQINDANEALNKDNADSVKLNERNFNM